MSAKKRVDILKKIKHLNVDTSELPEVFMKHFRVAAGTTEWLKFGDAGDSRHMQSCVQVKFNKHGKLIQANAINLDDERLNRIFEDIKTGLCSHQKECIAQIIAFSQGRWMNGYFNYKDVFQILPVPREAPRPTIPFADHPFLLELRYTWCIDPAVRIRRQIKKYIKILRILNLFTSARISYGHKYSESAWALNLDAEPCKSEWRPLRYNIDTKDDLAEFSDVSNFPKLRYFLNRSQALSEYDLMLNEKTEELLGAALALSESEYEQFFRAATWYYQAFGVKYRSTSAAFISFVSAIESLAHPYARSCPECNQKILQSREKCGKCEQPLYGITKHFSEFVERYAPDTDPEIRNILYQIRSRLAHGNLLLIDDLEPWRFGADSKRWEHWDRFTEIEQITADSIRNWLREKCKN